MAFTPKNWQNAPSTTTPVSAAGLIDLETRLSAYTDAETTRAEGAETSNATAISNETARATTQEGLAVKKSNNGNDFSDSGSTRFNLGVSPVTPAACVATANISTLSGLQTIDGYTLVAGDPVLLTSQTTASQNGLWVVGASTPYNWTRPTEFPSAGLTRARSCMVLNGTVNGGTQWLLKAGVGGITIDSTSQVWVSVGGSGGGGSLPSYVVTSTAPSAVTQRNGQFALRDRVHVKDYGALGGARSFTTGASVSSTTLTDTTNSPFSLSNVGMWVIIAGAGVAGTTFATTIASYTDTGHVTLTLAPPNATGATGAYQIVNDDTVAIQNAMNAGLRVDFSGDNYAWRAVYPNPGNVLEGPGVTAYKLPACTFLTSAMAASPTSITMTLPFAVAANQQLIATDGASNWIALGISAAHAASPGTPVTLNTATVQKSSGFAGLSVGATVMLAPWAMVDMYLRESPYHTQVSDGSTLNGPFAFRGFTFIGEGTAGWTTGINSNTSPTRAGSIYLVQAKDVVVEDVNSFYTPASSFKINCSQRVSLERCKSIGACVLGGQNAINFSDATGATSSVAVAFISVNNCYVDTCPTACICVQTSYSNTTTNTISLTNNKLYSTGWTSIAFELGTASHTTEHQNVVITGNHCGYAGTTTFSSNIMIYDSSGNSGDTDASKDALFTVAENVCTGSVGVGAIIYWGSSASIHDNIINTSGISSGAAGGGIIVGTAPSSTVTPNLQIHDNVIILNGTCGNGIQVSGTSGGATLGAVTHSQIHHNIINGSAVTAAGSAGAYGIYIGGGCQFIDIQSNRIDQPFQSGIYWVNMADSKIENNTIYDVNGANNTSATLGVGVYVSSTSGTRNRIAHNVIYDDRGTHQMQYAVNVAAAATLNATLIGNEMSGSVVGPTNGVTTFSSIKGNITDVPTTWPAAVATPTIVSGTAYTNSAKYDQMVYLSGGTGTLINYTPSGGSAAQIWASGSAANMNAQLLLHAGDAVTVTATAVPTAKVYAQG